MTRQISILLLIFLWIGFIHAQDDLPPPEDIFVDGVQWSQIKKDGTTLVDHYYLPIDNVKKVIQFYDVRQSMTIEYPFPETDRQISFATINNDGLIYVYLKTENNNFTYAYLAPENVLVLDPQTGEYHSPATVCDGELVPASFEFPTWIVAYHEQDVERPFLCNVYDDDIREVLPQGVLEWDLDISPHMDWLILIGKVAGDEDSNYVFYIYDVNKDELIPFNVDVNHLSDPLISVCDWVANSIALLCVFEDFWGSRAIYTYELDVTQPQNIHFIFTELPENIIRITQEKRFLVLSSDKYSRLNAAYTPSGHSPCTLILYSRDYWIKHEVGYECLPRYRHMESMSPFYASGEQIYYLTVASETATLSELHNYNFLTKPDKDTLLFRGEIESILSIYGHYAVLLMDNNGELDFSVTGFCCFDMRGWQVVILDMQTGKMVYQSEPIVVYMSEQVTWLDESTVVIAAMESDADSPQDSIIPSSLRRIHIGESLDTNITNHYYVDFNHLSLDTSVMGDYWIYDSHILVDLRTFETVPLIHESLLDDYQIYFSWWSEGELIVRIVSKDNYDNDVEYRVTLPASSSN